MSIEKQAQAERHLADVRVLNNNFLEVANNAKPQLDRIQALTGANKTQFEAALVALGVTVADFDTLVVALQGRVTDIRTNLTRIRDRLP